MRKKQKQLLGIIVILSTMICAACSDTPITYTGFTQPPLFGGYDESEAGVMMTLAALCYTAENNSNIMEIRDSLILQLSDSTYATGGNWKLAWGPGVSAGRGNMVYVAVDSTSDTIYFAIAVRGTDWNFPSNIEEDMEIWDLVSFPYGGAGDSVAEGSMKGLDTLLGTTDPVNGTTLQSFLNGITQGRLKMYITGHSLGGALATLVTSWFVKTGYTNRFKIETYTFAAPSVGTETYVNNFHNAMLSAGAQNHRVVNTKDLVPYAWAGLNNIVPNNIPTLVPLDISLAIGAIQAYLNTYGIVYKHVETRHAIGYLTPTNCPGETGTNENYSCWVAFEHAGNNYLRLLHADTVNVR